MKTFHWLRVIVLSLLSFFTIILFSLLLLSGTQSGTQWLFSFVNDLFDDELTYQQIQGDLLSSITVMGLDYKSEEASLHINKLNISWKPLEIFQKQFYIDQIQVNGIYIESSNGSKSNESKANNKDNSSTPELISETIDLPIDIIVNKLELSDIQIRTGSDEESVMIEHVIARTEVKTSTINILHFKIISSEYQFESYGSVVLQPFVPMVLNTNVKIKIKDVPEMYLQGQVKGDLNTLILQQSLATNTSNDMSNEVTGDIDVQIEYLLSDLRWQGSAQIQKIPFHLLDKTIDTKNATFDLSIKGEGDLDQATLSPLIMNSAQSQLTMNGPISWANDLQWDLELVTHQLDPSIIYPQWPGNIDLKMVSQGRQSLYDEELMDKAGLKLMLSIEQLQGSLQEQALSGSGRLDMQDDFIQVQNLQLGSGDASFKLNGQISQTLDLKWDIDIPELDELIPEMSGLLKGQGEFTGTQSQPVATGAIRMEKLIYDTFKVNQSELKFSLSSEANYSGYLSLSADELLLEDNSFQNTSISVKGTVDAHNINIKSNIANNLIKLNAKGRFLQSEPQWQGDINHFSFNSKTMGYWQQRESSKLLLSPEQGILDKLCLYDKKAFICTDAQWQSKALKADIQAGNLLLKKIKPWLGEEIEALSGEVNLEGQISMQEALKGKLNIELTPGAISYRVNEQKKVRLKHHQGQIQALFDEHKSTATWRLNLDKHDIKGNFEIPGTILDVNPEKTPIQGNIKLNIQELGLITAFIPQIQDAQGFINADLKINGVISQPNIEGVAEFVSDKISIPVTGVEYSKVNIKLKSHDNNLINVHGQLSSGEGVIDVNGQVTLNAKQNWPVSLYFKGENFQIINLPEIQAIISPEVEMQHGRGGIKVKGMVDIPQANIFVYELPAGSKSVSEDAIVVGEKAPEPANIDLDMTVKLGDDIHIKGLGLDAWLKGRMRIKKSPGQLATANGELRTTQGTFRAYGQNLSIEQGRISYAGGYLDDPGLNIRASKLAQDVTVGVMATGTAKNLDVSTYSSDYGLTSKDIVSLLLTGQKFDNAGNARIYAGTDLNDELSVGVNAGVGNESSEFVVRYKVRRNIHFEGFNSEEKSGGNLIYTIEIE